MTKYEETFHRLFDGDYKKLDAAKERIESFVKHMAATRIGAEVYMLYITESGHATTSNGVRDTYSGYIAWHRHIDSSDGTHRFQVIVKNDGESWDDNSGMLMWGHYDMTSVEAQDDVLLRIGAISRVEHNERKEEKVNK